MDRTEVKRFTRETTGYQGGEWSGRLLDLAKADLWQAASKGLGLMWLA